MWYLSGMSETPNSEDSSAPQSSIDKASSEPDERRRVAPPHDTIDLEFPVLRAEHLGRPRPRRRIRLPLILFLITCLSTFYAGAMDWQPMTNGSGIGFRRIILRHWDQGLTYMGCVLIILMTHELGHFFCHRLVSNSGEFANLHSLSRDADRHDGRRNRDGRTVGQPQRDLRHWLGRPDRRGSSPRSRSCGSESSSSTFKRRPMVRKSTIAPC